MKCCLGFECLLRGIEEGDLVGKYMPSNVRIQDKNEELLGLIDVGNFTDDSLFSNAAAMFNDIQLGDSVTHSSKFTELPEEVKTNIFEIVSDQISLSTEKERQEVIAYLFKYYLNRKVVFVNTILAS